MQHTGLYKKIGVIKKISANGMGVFEISQKGKDANGNELTHREEVCIAVPCAVGDVVVVDYNKKEGVGNYKIIKKGVYDALPDSEAKALEKNQEEILGEGNSFTALSSRLNELEKKSTLKDKEIAELKKEIEKKSSPKISLGEGGLLEKKGGDK
jgi:hypothetical protein